jgi:pyruvate dehydrogenase E2 component (dihydrolipoamide acetyltransferase)
MPISLTMPRLSDTMEAGTVIRWNVKEGDKVRSGDVVADIETDKATMEMQCFDDGTVSKLLVEPGKQVPVGTPIAMIEVKGEVGGAPAPAAPPPVAVPAAAAVPAAVPAARPVVEVEVVGERLRVSPVARRMAEELGVDLRKLKGTGPGGRVIKRDILAATEGDSVAETRQAAAAAPAIGEAIARPSPQSIETSTPLAITKPAAAAAITPLGAGRDIPLNGMRQTIARRLVESKQSIPHYQVTMRFAMDDLLAERTRLNKELSSYGVKLSVNDFLVRACALAMSRHPYFNASFAGDRIVMHGDVNVGVAISLDESRGGGLVVGVLRNADLKSLRQISQETRFLAEKAREKGLSMDEMSGATFTISNLGMYGVDHFTAIINPPNSAILACGAAIEQPVVRNHQLAVGWEMSATLSLDHRVIDGAMAAQYLATLKDLIERPAALLV